MGSIVPAALKDYTAHCRHSSAAGPSQRDATDRTRTQADVN